jgi:Ni,Fe-hydrogenase maturation factor
VHLVCDALPGADRRPLLVIGVGSWLRGDDGAGLEVARRLTGDERFAVRLHEGEIFRFDAGAQPLPRTLRGAIGHALGVAETIELARALGRLPRGLVVIGIEGESFAIGSGLSRPVRAAIDAVLEAVRAELSGQYSVQADSRAIPDGEAS